MGKRKKYSDKDLFSNQVRMWFWYNILFIDYLKVIVRLGTIRKLNEGYFKVDT